MGNGEWGMGNGERGTGNRNHVKNLPTSHFLLLTPSLPHQLLKLAIIPQPGKIRVFLSGLGEVGLEGDRPAQGLEGGGGFIFEGVGAGFVVPGGGIVGADADRLVQQSQRPR